MRRQFRLIFVQSISQHGSLGAGRSAFTSTVSTHCHWQLYRYARSQWWGLPDSLGCQKVTSGNACPHGTLSSVNFISEDKVVPLLSSWHSSSVKALLADLCPSVRSLLKLLDQILFGSEPFASGFLVTEKQLNPAEWDMKFSNRSWNPHSQDSVKSELHHDFEVL